MVTSTGEAYWMFQNTFGRDSYDGAGATMRTVNNDPRINCPNANWNGATTNYCDGVSSDDVVSHEWGHAYTEFTHGLIYQWQSGALNEAYSDVFGETLDLINGREDEGEGDITTPRPDGLCSKFTRGAIGATINSPAAIAGPCADAAAAAFGPVFDKTGVTTDVVVGTDAADEDGPTTTDGCSPLDNAADVADNFVYVDRGTCTFAVKIENAEAAGATGIIFGDNVADRPPISVAGVSDLYGLMVTQADGTKIKSVAGPVNMTIQDVEVEEKADSYRWLMGEKSDAFGGAIRDMWNPTCYGDPGKVSDAEYICGTEDSGGVHSNSGVINHGYSFLVDGGTFNDVTIEGIGITKALAIYYRAMTGYQTPISNFADHADALLVSCGDLVGETLKEPSTSPNDSVDSPGAGHGRRLRAGHANDQAPCSCGSTRPSSAPGRSCSSRASRPGVARASPRRTSSPRTSRTGSTAGPRPTRASSAVRRSTGRPHPAPRWRSRRVTATPARSRSARLRTRVTARAPRRTSAVPTISTAGTSSSPPTPRPRGCRSTTTSSPRWASTAATPS